MAAKQTAVKQGMSKAEMDKFFEMVVAIENDIHCGVPIEKVARRVRNHCKALNAPYTTPEHVAYRLMLTAQDFLAVATELMSS